MKMPYKQLTGLLAVALFAVASAGCGGDKKEAETDPSGDAESGAAETEPAPALSALVDTARTDQVVVGEANRFYPAQGYSPDLPANQSEAEFADHLRQQAEQAKAAALAKAAEKGWEVKGVADDGVAIFELVALDEDGGPIYLSTSNENARISTGVESIQEVTPYNESGSLDGSGLRVGVWDGGSVRNTHKEFSDRVSNMDRASLCDHSTHVAGTIGAKGVTGRTKGMAPAVRIHSFEWNNDLYEMAKYGANSATIGSRVIVSNHSYGTLTGWGYYGSTAKYNGKGGSLEDENFGRYSAKTRDVDQIIVNNQFFLVFTAAGNDRSNDHPIDGATFYSQHFNSYKYDARVYPKSDGWDDGGFDTVNGDIKTAKNTVTVGAVNDALKEGSRDLSPATTTTFSGWGPTDDGRIKPDIVADGADVYSATAQSDTSYEEMSGTSMATPNATGSATLLQQLYSRKFDKKLMRASTLKALILHTADDLGRTGPDYTYGWGLMNTKKACDAILAHYKAPNSFTMVECQLVNGVKDTYRIAWDGSSKLKATIVWTDPAHAEIKGLDNRARALVNDLDLRMSIGKSNHRPYVLDVENPSKDATTGDNTVDNVEQILLESPEAGAYTLTVSHKGKLQGGSQSYSLIVTGQKASSGSPAMTVAQRYLTQAVALGAIADSQSFTVGSSGEGTVSYSITTDTSWLEVSPKSGDCTGETDTITVSYKSSGLAEGIYRGSIIVTSPGSGSRIVSVALTAGSSKDAEEIPSEIAQISKEKSVGDQLTGEIVAGGNWNGSKKSQLSFPRSIAIGKDGSLFVADSRNSRVMKWAPGAKEGVVVAGGNGLGTANNQVHPYDIAIGQDGCLFISDEQKNRVTKWVPGAKEGVIVAGGNGEGSGNIQLNFPAGIAIGEDGSIFVSDSKNFRVMKRAPGAEEWVVVAGGNGFGSANNQVNPYGIAIGKDGSLFISDYRNYRVMKWVPGAKEGIVVAGGNGYGDANNQLRPEGLAIGEDGSLYVVDSPNHRVMKWAPGASEGVLLAGGNGRGSGMNQLDFHEGNYYHAPIGIAVAGDGSLLVPDPGNHRVMKWALPKSTVAPAASSGTLVVWGNNQQQQGTVPAELDGVKFKAIAGGDGHSLGLKEDGTVAAWGGNLFGALDIPPELKGGGITAIAAGDSYNLALKEDGKIVAWGYGDGATIPPELQGVRVTAIAAGNFHSLALKEDGTVVAWGWDASKQSTVPEGLKGVTAIAAGYGHSLALKEDGTVVAWGANEYKQATVPEGLGEVTAIAAAGGHNLILKKDGRVFPWGHVFQGRVEIPEGLKDVTAIAAGMHHSLALKHETVAAPAADSLAEGALEKRDVWTKLEAAVLEIAAGTGDLDKVFAMIEPAVASEELSEQQAEMVMVTMEKLHELKGKEQILETWKQSLPEIRKLSRDGN